MIQLRPVFAFTNGTPYLAPTGELWGVFCEIFKEIWPRYIESALHHLQVSVILVWTQINGGKLFQDSSNVHHLSNKVSKHTATEFYKDASRIFITTLRPEQNGRHFAYNIFKCIFWNENFCILIEFHRFIIVVVQLKISVCWFKWWLCACSASHYHYSDVIMSPIAFQITSLTIVYCLLNRLFRSRWKITSKLRVTGFCAGNSPVTGEFPAQRVSNAENISIWWRHHDDLRQCWTMVNHVAPLSTHEWRVKSLCLNFCTGLYFVLVWR